MKIAIKIAHGETNFKVTHTTFTVRRPSLFCSDASFYYSLVLSVQRLFVEWPRIHSFLSDDSMARGNVTIYFQSKFISPSCEDHKVHKISRMLPLRWQLSKTTDGSCVLFQDDAFAATSRINLSQIRNAQGWTVEKTNRCKHGDLEWSEESGLHRKFQGSIQCSIRNTNQTRKQPSIATELIKHENKH